MTTTTLPGTEVAAFAAAVRTALSDLPPDELDELTDGLEADLAERLDEAPDAAAGLGDPQLYAEELRAAAGYPPRSARSHLGDTLPNLRTLPQELRRRWETLLASSPRVRAVVDFLVALRPVWWVFRGLAVYVIAITFLGLGYNGGTWWPIAVGAIVLSVQLGRGRMLGRTWVRWLLRAASVVVIVAAPFMLQRALDTWANAGYYENAYYDQSSSLPGLNRDGTQIDKIFAYDAQGNPIDQVQLFDQNGQPLNLTNDTSAQWWDAADGSMVVPSGDVPGRAGWNVYPLAHVNDWSDYEDDGMLDDTEITPTQFPFGTAKPLASQMVQPMTDGSTPMAAPSPVPTTVP
jgi:hypothetical protein